MAVTLFRIWLFAILTGIAVYSALVIVRCGPDLLPVFFDAIAKVAWPGQFNLDFLFMLSLSALWVAWRHRFSAPGLGLALLAFFGGSLFLSVYLLVISWRTRGDAVEMLTGDRADGLRGASKRN